MNRFEKAAIQVIQPFDTHVKQKDFPSLATGKGSIVNLNDAKLLSKAMEAGAYHDALYNTRVELFGSKLNDMAKRVKDNPRNSWITKARFHNPYESDINTITQHLPDAYALEPDNVWLPSGNAGVLMHELGHAIDFNEYPKDSIIRHGLASAYSKFAPTLWKEHAAWRKGRDRLLLGAARTKLDPSILVKTLEQAARTKPMGLGSYWGSGIGTVGGLGLGGLAAAAIAAGTQRFPIALPILGAGIGGTIGALAGTSLGKAYGNKKSLGDEAAIKSYMNEYADAYSKEHGIPKEEALSKIEALREAIKAKSKKQKLKENNMSKLNKAAEFGSMMGKMALLNKSAANRRLGDVAKGSGPQQMSNALSMFNQAKALVDPTEHLESVGLSRGAFDDTISRIAKNKGDNYSFSDMKRSPQTEAIIKGLVGAAAGGLVGKYTGQGIGNSLGLAALGGLGGAGIGHLGASRHNSNLLSTAKVLKEYGLLKPEYLRDALPLLQSNEEKPWYEKAMGAVGL